MGAQVFAHGVGGHIMLLVCKQCKLVLKSWAAQCPRCGGPLEPLHKQPVLKGHKKRGERDEHAGDRGKTGG